jgi:hypothetical protein
VVFCHSCESRNPRRRENWISICTGMTNRNKESL